MTSYQHEHRQRRPLFYEYVSHVRYPFRSVAQRQLLRWSVPQSGGGLPGRIPPFHHHRDRTPVRSTIVHRMDVLQHFASGQRSLISEVPIKVFNALCVSAGETDEDRTPIVSTNAVHNKRVQNVFPYQRDLHHLSAKC